MFIISVNYCVFLHEAAELKEQTGNSQRKSKRSRGEYKMNIVCSFSGIASNEMIYMML